MREFAGALYNEEAQLESLVEYIYPYVDRINFVDDGSTDSTPQLLKSLSEKYDKIYYKTIPHTGLCEVARAWAIQMCDPNSWVIMLDADERFTSDSLEGIISFTEGKNEKNITHVWSQMNEYIDGKATRYFLKCRFFKASAAEFANDIHRDDNYKGQGANFNWTLIHDKTSNKQTMREKEYLDTYKRLLKEGKIDKNRYKEMIDLHYYVRE